MEWSLTWQVVSVDQWTEVKWCIAVENFVWLDSDLVLNLFQNLQPVQTDESMSPQAIDQSGHHIQDRLEMGFKADQDAISIVQL